MKKILTLACVGVVALSVGATAGRAAVAPPDSTFCIAGATESLDLTNPSSYIAARFFDFVAQYGGYYIDQHDHVFVNPRDTTGLTRISVQIGPCATAPPPQVDNVFLCYSAYQVNPGVWPANTAAALLKSGGYWSPYAVPGNVTGGTNIGGYHLACNLAAGQSAGNTTLGGAGETVGPGSKQDVSNVPGWYPVVP